MLYVTHAYCRRGAARTDVIAVCCCLALLIPLLAAGLGGPARRGAGQLSVACMRNLQTIGAGVAMCFAENNDYGPTDDDAVYARNMLNWTDVLYDLDYVPTDDARLCPADEHPDEATEARAIASGSVFQDNFDSNQPPRRGVRTSYALNSLMRFNFKPDRFEQDPSRQVYAIDGWWTWFGSLNARWVYAPRFFHGRVPSPVGWPNWQGTMVGWRHGTIFSANSLFLDGHVARVVTKEPKDRKEWLRFRTVNTLRAFTWLPGEETTRLDFDRYGGSIDEYRGRYPYFTDPVESKVVGGFVMPIDYPDHLNCAWRTAHDAWIKFPNDRN